MLNPDAKIPMPKLTNCHINAAFYILPFIFFSPYYVMLKQNSKETKKGLYAIAKTMLWIL